MSYQAPCSLRVAAVLLLAFAATCCVSQRSQTPRRLAPSASTPEKIPPSSWFLGQRGGSGAIPVAARTRAIERARAAGLFEQTTGTWVPAGPRNIPGRVSALAMTANNPQRIWLGSAAGGVFLSETGGALWTPVFDDQPVLSIGAIAAHPTDSDVAYVGTGEETGGGYSYDGEGVFRTMDGGSTWTWLGLAEVRRIGDIAIDPQAPDRVYVAAVGGLHNRDEHRGVYRSVDGGNSWNRVLFVQDDAGAVDLAIDPQNPDRVFAAVWQRNRGDFESYYGGDASGLWRSTDGGDTWTELTNGLPAGTNVGRIGVAIAESNPQIVYASYIKDTGFFDGVYRSADGGDSWVKVSSPSFPGSLSSYGYYFGRIHVDPVDPDTSYLLDLALWRSTNGGLSYGQVGASMHVDQHALLIGPGERLLAGNDGGVYHRADATSPFLTTLLANTQFYDLCIDPTDANRRYGGTQDNGTLRTVSGGAFDWASILGGDGMQCVINPFDPNLVLAEAQWGFIFRSEDGGDTMVPTSGINPSDRNNWVTPIVADPVDPQRAYTGTQRVYRSFDFGANWQVVSNDLSNGHHEARSVSDDPEWRLGRDHGEDPIQGTVTAIAVSPVNNVRIWAGTDDGNVWVSQNDTASWAMVNPPGPAYWVTEIAADPFNGPAAWMTVTGYRLDDTMPYLRYTPDLGQSWQDLSAGLPQVPLNSVVPDPDWRGRLFVGSDLGVHLTEDGGLTWALVGEGMPYVVVQDLVLHGQSRTLFAGTHGRSMFEFDLDQLPPPDGDGDGVDNNADCALADPGAFAEPPEVPQLDVDRGPNGESALTWMNVSASSGPDTFYDLASGDLQSLSASGTSAAFSLACGLTTTAEIDPSVPAPGQGVYYLVRASNTCGTGSWGVDSAGSPRVLTACP